MSHVPADVPADSGPDPAASATAGSIPPAERSSAELVACRNCGLIQRRPAVYVAGQVVCHRCARPLDDPVNARSSRQRTLAATVGALLLYVPAVTLPIVEIRQLGHRHASSLISGTWELLTHGEWFVGLVVLLFSIVLPLVKIGLLLELSLFKASARRHRAATYRWMEHVGKWSMLDVLLVALLVMLVKLGNLVQFQVGPAVWAFGLCVVMSLVASMSFDPRSIWEEHERTSD